MKWTNSGGVYEFEISEVSEINTTYDLKVKYLIHTDYFWFPSLNAAKRFVKSKYDGLDFGRWVKAAK